MRPKTIMKRWTLAPDRAALAEEIAGLSKAGIANLLSVNYFCRSATVIFAGRRQVDV
jgi:hypothetical protein